MSSIKVDIFDHSKFPKDVEVLQYFYSGLEFYLRAAIFLSYKYNHLSPKNRDILDIRINKRTGNPVIVKLTKRGNRRGFVLEKDWVDNITDVFEPYYLLKNFYKHHNPEKLKGNYLQDILKKYCEYEDVAFNKMYRMYVDPNWDYQPLWFTKKTRTTTAGKRELMIDYYRRIN